LPATLDRTEIDGFRALVQARLGLAFDGGKADELADVLRERVESSGLACGGHYLGRLARAGEHPEEWRVLAQRLTVTETYFFRYWDHFRAFSEVVLPERLSAGAGKRELHILSAGCASGEEAYSLAILARERLAQESAPSPIRIVAIDINGAMIQKALRGRYASWSMRETPAVLRDRHFRTDGREFVLSDAVRSMVSFEERNLLDPDPAFWAPGRFDIVFCRNVSMYFSVGVARLVIERIARALAPGGYLFLGHAETLRGLSDGFRLRHTHDTFYYQLAPTREHGLRPTRHDAAPTPAARPPAPAPPAADGSWAAAIHEASQRVAALARAHSSGRTANGATALSPSKVSPRQGCTRPAGELGSVVGLLMRERFVDALELLDSVSGRTAADPDAQLLRAVLLTNGGEFAEAKETCRRLLALDELNAGAHYLLALCYEHDGNRPRAAEHDRTSSYLDATFAMPRFHLGLLARRQGDSALARTELGQALALFLREDSSRILIFGGGFSREALMELCRQEIEACGESR
jgi:chemotaxis protein methyltransferase CheR